MQNSTLPERHPVQRDKKPNPTGVGDLWTVSGPFGRVSYDGHSGRVELADVHGDIDAAGGSWKSRAAEYAQLGDDEALYQVLTDLYRTDLAGGAR